jgi:hypothetical protein
MSLRLLLSFLVGVGFFTVLPIYLPFVLLQTTDMLRFLLGLVAEVVAGAVLALINGPGRGLLLVLACAFVGASLYVFAYLVPMFSEGGTSGCMWCLRLYCSPSPTRSSRRPWAWYWRCWPAHYWLGGGERSTRALGCPRQKRMFRFRPLLSDLLWWRRGKASERLRHGGEVATAQCGS